MVPPPSLYGREVLNNNLNPKLNVLVLNNFLNATYGGVKTTLRTSETNRFVSTNNFLPHTR